MSLEDGEDASRFGSTRFLGLETIIPLEVGKVNPVNAGYMRLRDIYIPVTGGQRGSSGGEP